MLICINDVRRHRAGTPISSDVYRASGVTFNNARLELASLACADNEFFSFAGWLRGTFSSYPGVPWTVDPNGSANYYLQGLGAGGLEWSIGDGGSSVGVDLGSPPLSDDTWIHLIATVSTNEAAGSKANVIYVNDVAPSDSATVSHFDSGSAFAIAANGKSLYVGDDSFDDFFLGEMADLSLWPGVSFLDEAGDIPEATRRLFIDANGKPVNPSTAIATLGTPAVMLTGGSAAFGSNSRGASGTLTLATGTLTDASTSPSD